MKVFFGNNLLQCTNCQKRSWNRSC